MKTLITANFGTPNPADFKDQYQHKYFCEIVQGEVSNDVRIENSVPFTVGEWMPTGSIAYIENGAAKAGAGTSTATKLVIPQIVYVGMEHANVMSEKYNSGCGLITTIPLNVTNKYMTTVFDEEDTYAPGDLLTVGSFTFDGKTVQGVKKATTGKEVIVGVVDTAPMKHHLGPMGIVFVARFQPATA